MTQSSAKLRRYVFSDHRRRLHDDRIGMLLGVIAALLFLFIGESERTATIASVVMLFVFMTFSTFSYCVGATKSNKAIEVNTASILYQPVTGRLAFLSAAVILLLAPLPGVEAAVVDKRLRRLLARPLDLRAIDELTNTVTNAVQRRVQIPASTMKSVQNALDQSRVSGPPNLSKTADQASAITALATIGWPPGMVGPVYDQNKQLAGRPWEFKPIATNTGPDSYQWIGITDNPADVAFMKPLTESRPLDTFGPAFFVAKDMKATLDGWHLRHIVFQNMTLAYSGGPLLLEGVCFLQCHFEFADNANAAPLVDAVKTLGWVSFTRT